MSEAPWPPPLPAALERFAAATLGELEGTRFCGWQHAASRVWELQAARGMVYLKAHSQDRKFKQELHAYRAWAPALASCVPELLAAHSGEPAALLLGVVPGEVMEGQRLAPAEEEALHAQAGRFLRRLHALPFSDDDPMPPEAALRVRAAAYCERAAMRVSDEAIAWVRAELSVAGRFAGLRRVPCHRDFSPRNWLYQRETGRFFVIDFEHARPDVWLSDLLKLWDGPWRGRPELERAFFAGYFGDTGCALSARASEQLRALGALHALATTVWSLEHGDAAYEAHGRALLARLRDESPRRETR